VAVHTLFNGVPYLLSQRVLQSRILITSTYNIHNNYNRRLKHDSKCNEVLKLDLSVLNNPYTADDLSLIAP